MKNSRFALLKNRLTVLALCFFSILLLRIGVAQADLGPSLSLRSAYWGRNKGYSPERSFGMGSAWITLRPDDLLDTRVFFEGYVANNDLSRGTSTLVEVREGYLERALGDFDFRLGRQVLIWGRADKVNPTDQWSSKNMTLLFTDDDDQRLGNLSMMATYHFEPFRVLLIYQPEWRFPIYPIPPIPSIALENQNPKNRWGQFGIKLDQTGGWVDWSISVSNVLSKTPNLSVVSAGSSGTTIGLNYETIQVYGVDFATNLGSFGFRGEAAYTHSLDHSGTDPLRFNSELFTVVGADHTLFENFNLNFQTLYKHVFGFTDPGTISDANIRTLALQQNLISNQLGSDRFGITFRPSYKMLNDTLEFEVAYVQWFGNLGGLLRPKVTYAFNDHLKTLIGTEQYFGVAESFFGRLKELSSFFLEMRASL